MPRPISRSSRNSAASYVVRGGKFTGVEGQSRSRNVVIEFDGYDDGAGLLQFAGIPGQLKARQPHSIAELVVIEGYDGPQP